MRLFLAIFPPREIGNSFKKIQERLMAFEKNLKFVDPAIIHMTVRFLGAHISDQSFKKIFPVIRSVIVQQDQFNVRIKEARFGFPGRRWPRILYVSIARSESLNKLLSCLNLETDSLNLSDIYEYKHQGNPIHHFTLARSRKNLTRVVVANIRSVLAKCELWEGLRVKEISLVKSKLTREGPEYQTVEEFKLRK